MVVAASPCGGECRLVASQKAVLVAVEHPRLHAGQAEALELCYLLDWVAIAESDGAFLTELQLWEPGPMEVACVNPVSCTQRTIMDKKKQNLKCVRVWQLQRNAQGRYLTTLSACRGTLVNAGSRPRQTMGTRVHTWVAWQVRRWPHPR